MPAVLKQPHTRCAPIGGVRSVCGLWGPLARVVRDLASIAESAFNREHWFLLAY